MFFDLSGQDFRADDAAVIFHGSNFCSLNLTAENKFHEEITSYMVEHMNVHSYCTLSRVDALLHNSHGIGDTHTHAHTHVHAHA